LLAERAKLDKQLNDEIVKNTALAEKIQAQKNEMTQLRNQIRDQADQIKKMEENKIKKIGAKK